MDAAQLATWPVAEVLALAPDAVRAAGAARRIAVPADWGGLGHDHSAVWGVYGGGSGSEPYEVAVSLPEPASRCTCPSRQRPCKHALALLLLWSAGHVAETGSRPGFAAVWLAELGTVSAPAPPAETASGRGGGGGAAGDTVERTRSPRSEAGAARRVDRVVRGLTELDRWMADCVRAGLTAPALARYSTWDEQAARLVDAQAPALANRVKRLAGAVGTRPGWHEHVLAEMGSIHLLCEAGRRVNALPDDLADSVRTALGWTVRQADVIATAPETDRWFVCGRSDTVEDRIVVRRWWLRGQSSPRWCLLLGFAAYGQVLTDPFHVGDELHGDLHRYPGRNEVRCVLGSVQPASGERSFDALRPGSVAAAADETGAALAAVPWTERWPVTLRAAPTLEARRWTLTDDTGSLPLAADAEGLTTLVALSRGAPLAVTCEWTAAGLVPLAAHLEDRSVDLGPRGSFDSSGPRRWRR